jgi:repressor LexA
MKDLTNRQAAVLAYIVKCVRNTNLPPTLREICLELGIVSVNSAASHLLALEQKGFVERERGKARCISLTDKVLSRWGGIEKS